MSVQDSEDVYTQTSFTASGGTHTYGVSCVWESYESENLATKSVTVVAPDPEPQQQSEPESDPPSVWVREYYDTTGIYYISENGTAGFRLPLENSETVTIPDTINVDGDKVPVTNIIDRAFYGNKKLATINIGCNVKEIGASAFGGCRKLKNVNGGENVQKIGNSVFKNCFAMKNITIGETVKYIGDKAFYGCVALKKFVIGEKVNHIGRKAFYGCSKLKTITIRSLLLTKSNIGSKAFEKINGKATFKCPKGKKKEYMKILKKKGAPKGAKYK